MGSNHFHPLLCRPLLLKLNLHPVYPINVFGLNFQTGNAEYSSYVRDLFIEPNKVAWLSLSLIGLVAALFIWLIALNPNYKQLIKKD